MIQFNRQYRLTFGSGAAGAAIGEGTPEALRISFRIEKMDTESPDTAKISLWNLSPDNIAALNEEDCVVTLQAGYAGFMPLVFKGVVTYTETVLDSADRETYFEAQDCRVELRDTYVSLSYEGPINSQVIINDIASQMGLAPNFSHNAEFHDFPKGFSYVGPARVAMDKACASSALRWKAENEILHVKINRDALNQEVYVLSPETGLIGVPKKITFGGDTEGHAQQTGWQVEYFLNGAIGVSDYVKLESKFVSGYFRVMAVDMIGDNLEGDWLCTAQLIEG